MSVNPLGIDISDALRELRAPNAAAAVGDPGGKSVPRPRSPSDGHWVEHRDGELPEDEVLSGESSDPEVIHIDLTQRPPPLPMSGLALEQIVSMLPGNTYALAGSGIPMRTSPRSEPRQHSPSAKATSNRHSTEMGTACADQSAEAAQEGKETNADDAQSPSAHSNGGQGASGSPRSPTRVALTFVPGLGLVPIVIHDAMDEEGEEESYDQNSDTFEVELIDSPGDAVDALSKSAAAGDEISTGVAADGDLPTTRNETVASPLNGGQGAGEEVGVNVASGSSEAEAIRTAAPDLSRNASKDGLSVKLEISKEQLSDIIQQAMLGLDFQGVLTDEDDNNLHDEDDGNLQSQSGVSPVLHDAVFKTTFDADTGARRATACDGERESRLKAQAHQLLADREGDEPRPSGAAESDRFAVAAPHASCNINVSDNAACGKESGDYDDDLVDEEGEDSLEEVDDSGSGGADEPESILGGLSHARLGFASDGMFRASAAAHMGQHTSPVEASGILCFGAANVSATSDPSPVFASHGFADPRPKGRVTDSSGVGGLPLPRPRYMAHDATRPYDASCKLDDEDPPLNGADRKAAVILHATASSVEGTITSAAPHPTMPESFISGVASKVSSNSGSSSTTSTPVAVGSSGSSSSIGSDLNSTFRGTGQSLAAIRQAALQAEAQRQAKLMAERLGGGGDDSGPKVQRTDRLANRHHLNSSSNHPERPVGKPAADNNHNPFGDAEQEASAAAGLIDFGGRHRAVRHGSSSTNTTTGYANTDSRQKQFAANENDKELDEDGHGDLEDLLRDRPIIQPRYPTGTKGREAGQPHCKDMHDLSSTMEADDSGSWRPRHRRSVDMVDLDMLAKGEANMEESFQVKGRASRGRSADGSEPPSHPNPRSLLATRKSDDGQQLAPPLPSSSPRLERDEGGSDGSGVSSSAHSVADERLVDELEALREELGQKTTLVAGLRGELRKYTDLAMRLEQQLNELRTQGGDAGSAIIRARYCRSQSDAGAVGSMPAAAARSGLGHSEQPSQQRDMSGGVGAATSPAAAQSSRPPNEATAAAGGTLEAGVTHTLPPHPQAQGLEGLARLTLYREILSQAQLQVGRSGGPAPPDLRDAQELFKGKENLDAGTEKVMLIKLQKIVTWGCEAAWKASVAQQQVKFMENAAQQAAQARSAWEAEREQLQRALQKARSAHVQAAPGQARSQHELEATGVEAELWRQLRATQDEAAAARNQAADLESVVASLNADVRRLRGQLRSSRDGGQEEAAAADAAEEQVARSDSKAWAMERKLLLSTITSLRNELGQASTVSLRPPAVQDGLQDRAAMVAEAAAGLPPSEQAALADAASGHVQEVQAKRDAPLRESASLRPPLVDPLADLGRDGGPIPATTANPAASERAESDRLHMEQLRQELAAARDALERRTVDAEAALALHKQESGALRAEVIDLRQELALTAADLAAAVGWREEDRRALEAERAAIARKEDLIQELQRQLQSCEVELDELKTAFSKEAGEKCTLEEKLRHARKALTSALLTAENADLAAEQQSAAAGDPLGSEHDTVLAGVDIHEALKAKTSECEHLQQLVEIRTRELAHADAKLGDVRAAVSALTAEASQTQAQVADLQALLETMQHAREVAEADLAGAIEEARALKDRVSSLEDEVEKARADASFWRERVVEAESAATEARDKVSELRAYAAGLQAEARDLRTALSAEDNVQAQLRGQVSFLESELEAQASLAHKRGEQAAQMEVALAEAEHHRQDTAAESVNRTELQAAQAAAMEAQQRVRELEARHMELQDELAQAVCSAGASIVLHGTNLEQHHMSAGGQRARTVGQEAAATPNQGGERQQERHPNHPAGASLESRPQCAGATGGPANCGGRSGTRVILPEHRWSPGRNELEPQADQRIAEQVEGLRTERAQLLADCAALRVELEQVRSGEHGCRDAEAQVEALHRQLQAARSDLQAARADLQAANVELSVKEELMAAKDRSLATLQETVDALKLALQVTQQNLQPTVPSPRRVVTDAEAGDGEGTADGSLDRYRCTVAALQSKFTESESTIRRLEKQVAALETRLTADEGLSPMPTPTLGRTPDADRRRSSQVPSTGLHATDTAALEQQIREKDDENARLLQELESMRGPISAAAADLGHAVGTSPLHGLTGTGGADAASAMTINSLQMQLEQWRNVSEDLHSRYQSKKEAVRRLREQLSADQKRRVDEQAQGQVQLETASQRLSRLATDLGSALRRCITLDLQPLSATVLTTSPRPGGGALPEDINALAALLSRQGAALIESLEAALDQVNSAREERTLLTAQLANRQAVLDELRHHLAHQAVTAPMRAEAVGTAAAAVGNPPTGPVSSQVSPLLLGVPSVLKPADVRQVVPTVMGTIGGAPAPAAGCNTPAGGLTAAVDSSLPAVSTLSPSSQALHTAAVNLAQDMAALSAQQAGLRSTLQGFEQRLVQQPSRPRSLSAAAYPPTTSTAYSLYTTHSYPAISPLRGSSAAAVDGQTLLTAAVPDGSPPHAYVGLISGSRVEPRTPIAATSTGGSLQSGLRQTYSLHSQQSLSSIAPSAQSAECSSRVLESFGRHATSMAAFRSPPRPQFMGSPIASSTNTATPPGGSSGLSAAAGLVLSRERRLKLAESGL